VASFANSELNPTPEPASVVLLGIGFAGLLVMFARKRSWQFAAE
jgi:hypothetical protein